MLSSKELKKLKTPTFTKEMREIASLFGGDKVFILSCQKVGKYNCINLFKKNGELYIRYFINKEETVLIMEGVIKRNSLLITTLQRGDFWNYEFAGSEETTKKIQEIKRTPMDFSEKNLRQVVYYIDEEISSARKRQRLKKKEKCFDEVMSGVRALPKNKHFLKTINRANDKHYLFFSKRNKYAECSYCGKQYDLKIFPVLQQKDVLVCPNCKKRVIARNASYKTHTKNTYDVVLVQAYGPHKLIERYVQVDVDYSEGEKKSLYEFHRTILDFDSGSIDEYEYYWFNEKLRWCTLQPSFYCHDGDHHKYYNGLLYEHNLTRELKKAGLESRLCIRKSFLKREKIKEMYKGKNIYKHVYFFEKMCTDPYLEKLIKSGLNSLAENLFHGYSYGYYRISLNRKENSLISALKLNEYLYKQAVSLDISKEELDILQAYVEVNKDFSLTAEEIIAEGKVFEGKEREAFKYPKERRKKIARYIKKQNADIIQYFDYLSICRSLSYDTSLSGVAFPPNFKKAHDDAAIMQKSKKLYAEYQKISVRIDEMHKRFDYEQEDLLIRAPFCGREITSEGHLLGHCVNSYVPKVAEGKTNILFIRKKENPEKPYVTVEVDCNGRFIQARAKSDAKPEQRVWDFISDFKKEKKIV